MRRTIGTLLMASGVAMLLPTSLAAGKFQNAGQIVAAIEQRFETVSEYRCQIHTVSVLGSLKEERRIDYVFRRPRLIRMRVLSGKDRGSVLVYKDGVVRGRRGGLLSWITLTFKPDDPDVVTIRGGRIDQSDFLFIMEALRNAADQEKLRLEETTTFRGKEHFLLTILQHVSPLDEGAARGTFWIDAKELVVSQYELYDKDGQLIYKQVHDQLEINVSLPDESFKL